MGWECLAIIMILYYNTKKWAGIIISFQFNTVN